MHDFSSSQSKETYGDIVGQSENASVFESVETLTDRSVPYVTSYSTYPAVLDVCVHLQGSCWKTGS